jgi:hypothetical protein
VVFIECPQHCKKIKDILIGGSNAENHPAQFVKQEGQEKGVEKISPSFVMT